MLSSLNSGVSGLQQFQTCMDVIGNNIANVNTVGYKDATTELADNFSNNLLPAQGNDISAQVGQGVTTEAVYNNFTQGSLSSTGVPTDLAISGNGFLLVKDPTTGTEYATRAGDLRIDASNYLVTADGKRVQGYSTPGGSTVGDIQIDASDIPSTSDPNATMTSFKINTDGTIAVQLSDGTSYSRGQILLQNFSNPQALVKEGDNLYSGLTGAGPLAAPAAPGTNGTGSIQSGALELSNVDLANEMAQLITAQRAFESNAKIITTSDQMLQDLVNLKQ